MTEQEIPSSVECQTAGDHPVFAGLSSVQLLRPAGLDLKPMAQMVQSSTRNRITERFR